MSTMPPDQYTWEETAAERPTSSADFPTYRVSCPKSSIGGNSTEINSRTQIGGDHYKRNTIQPWDYVVANNLDYFQGSIIKYVTRWKDKGGLEDLKKAQHFLNKYMEEISNGRTFGRRSGS